MEFEKQFDEWCEKTYLTIEMNGNVSPMDEMKKFIRRAISQAIEGEREKIYKKMECGWDYCLTREQYNELISSELKKQKEEIVAGIEQLESLEMEYKNCVYVVVTVRQLNELVKEIKGKNDQ